MKPKDLGGVQPVSGGLDTIPRVPEGRLNCMGMCGQGEVCRDLTNAMGYCAEPRIRARLMAGEPIQPGDWSKTWWKSDRKSKGPAPRKEQAPKPVQKKIKVKV